MKRLRSGLGGAARALLWLVVSATAAFAQVGETGLRFFPELDTGGHRAAVRSLSFSADGDWLVSASDDRTVRIWDWRSGVTVRTLRGQIGEGGEGKVNAASMSPDGSLVATGGVFGPVATGGPYGDVRVFDARNGSMAAVLKGLARPVTALAFSPDGTLLAAGDADGYFDLWRRDPDAEGGWRKSLRIDTGASGSQRVAFMLDGRRLATASGVAGFALWDAATGAEIAVDPALRGTGIIALAADATGARLAIGTPDGAVIVASAETGGVLTRLPDRPFLPAALAFELWDPENSALEATYSGLSGASFAIAVAPDGATVAIAEGRTHGIELWNSADLAPVDHLAGAGGPVRAVGISPDATTIAWGGADPCPERPICPEQQAPLDRMLPMPTPARSFVDPMPVDTPQDFDRAVQSTDGTSLVAGEAPDSRFPTASLAILHAGAATAEIVKTSRDGYYHAAFGLMPGAAELVTGAGDGTLLAYATADGRFSGEYGIDGVPGHDGAVLDIAAASKRPLLVTGSADQTLRLWNRDTRREVVSLFVAGDAWVLWTPQGYYHSSPDGDRFIGWRVNQGPDEAARFVTARQLKRHLNSPEIVRRSIITADAAAAAEELRGTDTELAALLADRPLDFEIRVLNEGMPVDGRLRIEIVQSVVEGVEPETFDVLVNDRLVSTLGGRDITAARQVVDVPVGPGENRISVTGFNALGYMTERGTFVMTPVNDAAPAPRGTLFVAVVGVQDYPLLPDACNGRPCDLRFPVADAARFAEVVASHTAPMFDRMEVLAMVNTDRLPELPDGGTALRSLVKDADILEPDARTVGFELTDFLERPGPDDTTILFVAGHGINIDEDYYLVPSDGQQRDPGDWRRASLVRWRDIQDAMERAKGRKLLFVDTCHAGNAYNVRLEKDSVDARIAVISATAANNVALELPELGHGVFSYALIRGLDGAAAGARDQIGILDLAAYISNEVVRLSHERQTPVYHFPQPVTNFAVAKP